MSLSHEKHPMIFKILKILPAFVLRIPTFDSAAEPKLGLHRTLREAVFGVPQLHPATPGHQAQAASGLL